MPLQRIAPTIAFRCLATLPVWLPCKIFFTTADFPIPGLPKVLSSKWRSNHVRHCEEERRSNLIWGCHHQFITQLQLLLFAATQPQKLCTKPSAGYSLPSGSFLNRGTIIQLIKNKIFINFYDYKRKNKNIQQI